MKKAPAGSATAATAIHRLRFHKGVMLIKGSSCSILESNSREELARPHAGDAVACGGQDGSESARIYSRRRFSRGRPIGDGGARSGLRQEKAIEDVRPFGANLQGGLFHDPEVASEVHILVRLPDSTESPDRGLICAELRVRNGAPSGGIQNDGGSGIIAVAVEIDRRVVRYAIQVRPVRREQILSRNQLSWTRSVTQPLADRIG